MGPIVPGPVVPNPPQTREEVDKLSAELYDAHVDFIERSQKMRCPTSFAAFLLILGLIVTVCSCLCLTLPGVNVSVILPGLLPGIISVVLSIPFVVKTVLLSKEKTRFFEQDVFPKVKLLFRSPMFVNYMRDQSAVYVRTKIMNMGDHHYYKDYYQMILTRTSKYFTERKKQFPVRKEEYELRTKVIQDVMKHLYEPAYKRERKKMLDRLKRERREV